MVQLEKRARATFSEGLLETFSLGKMSHNFLAFFGGIVVQGSTILKNCEGFSKDFFGWWSKPEKPVRNF